MFIIFRKDVYYYMEIKKYVTDVLNRKYFKEETIETKEYKNEENNIINIHPEIKYQKWYGLGGALTNASIHNLNKLDLDNQNKLLKEYFEGLNYNFLRLPIGSTDFSVKKTEDYKEDFEENVKYIKKIQEIKDIEIISTPWSPPIKYKTKDSLYGGKLKKESYNEYADYIVEFINDYKSENIDINYLSVQNEPFVEQIWESCKYDLDELKDFTYNYLIPKLKGTKILLWDHNKENLYNIFKELYEPNPAVKGIAFHWYSGAFFKELDLIRQENPFILLIETEMCCGFSRYNRKKWINDAELYLSEIINGINHGLNALLDWNLLLDSRGGPNHKWNFCKSPIILDKRKQEYIKTPIYYYLKHIGIANKSEVVASSIFSRDSNLEVVALKRDKLYITVLNKNDTKQKIKIKFGNELIKDKIDRNSVITYVI